MIDTNIKSESVRHLQPFHEMMKKYHGGIEFLVYAAEINCNVNRPDGGCLGCKFGMGECKCFIVSARSLLGDHVIQHDATGAVDE